jgi:hypothetical protein
VQYKVEFLQKMLTACNNGMELQESWKASNIKGVIWKVAKAWDTVFRNTMLNGWHNRWSSTFFLDGEDGVPDFCGFHVYEEEALMKDLLSYAISLSCKEVNLLDEEIVAKCLNTDEDVPVWFN